MHNKYTTKDGGFQDVSARIRENICFLRPGLVVSFRQGSGDEAAVRFITFGQNQVRRYAKKSVPADVNVSETFLKRIPNIRAL